MGLFPRHPGLDPESSAVGPCGRHRQDRKEMPKDAIAKYGAPEILTTVTCLDWKEARAEQPEIRISRDGRGRAKEIWKDFRKRYNFTIFTTLLYLPPLSLGD